MDKKQEKLIDSPIEQRKTLWTALIVLTGGIAGLVLSFNFPILSFSNISKLFLLITGCYFYYLFFEGLSSIGQKLEDNLK